MKRKPVLLFLNAYKEYYVVLTIYSILISVLVLATPISVQSLVNTFSFGPLFQPIFILSLLLLSLLTFLGIVKSLQYLLVEYLQRKLFGKVTAAIGRAYLLPDEPEASKIRKKAHRFFDVITIQKNLAYLATEGLALGLQAILGLFLIALYHPFFILFGILIFGGIVTPFLVTNSRARHSASEESTSKYEVARYLENLSSKQHSTAESINHELQQLDGEISNFLKKRGQHFQILFIQNISYLVLYALINALLLGLGGFLVISNQLSIGQLVASEIVVNSILTHFLYARKYLESYYDLCAAIEKVDLFFEHVEDLVHKSSAPSKREGLYQKSWTKYFSRFLSIRAVYAPIDVQRTLIKFLGAIIVMLTLLSFIPWQQTSKGSGRVTAYNPNDRVQTITATVKGIVDEWLVQDGQSVQKGDPIVRIMDNDPNYLDRLENKRDAALAKFNAAKAASDTARLNYDRQKELLEDGLSAQKDVEKAKIEYKKLLAKEASAAADLAKAEVDLSRQQLQVVKAPRDGQIMRILKGSGTTNVKIGEALAEFVPFTEEKIVEMMVDGNDLPLITKGRKVRLQFEGWPAIQFSGWPSVAIGSFGGVVTAIDPSVSPDGRFRILVRPDPDEPVPWPEKGILRQGTRTIGIVLLEPVALGYELWRQINGFPKSLPNPPQLESSHDNK